MNVHGEEFAARRAKSVERQGYNLIAARYAAAASARAKLHAALVDAARLSSGQAVLDVASGPALLAALAAPRVMPGVIVASDFAEQTLAQAPERIAGQTIMRVAADAEALPFADCAFDRVLCGLGLMFFPDERRALVEMARVLAPDGVLALSVWGDAAQVPLIECALACMRRLLPPPKTARRSVFHLGAPDRLGELLRAAGFSGVAVEPFVLESAFEDADAYWQAFLDLAGGAAGSIARLPQEAQAKLRQGVARELAPYRADDGCYRLASTVLIATAAKGPA